MEIQMEMTGKCPIKFRVSQNNTNRNDRRMPLKHMSISFKMSTQYYQVMENLLKEVSFTMPC
jgi:hypothetical protein